MRARLLPFLMMLVPLLAPGCSQPRPVVPPPPPLTTLNHEPVVRVRVLANTPRVFVRSDVPITIADEVGIAQPHQFNGPLAIAHGASGYVIEASGRRPMQWALSTLKLTSPDLAIGDRSYSGTLVVVPSASQNGRLDVIHHVTMEKYLPGVLEKELYSSWKQATFEAQAIAARSYAIWQRGVAPHRHYDLESTTASQVYGGISTHKKALAAVKRTHGQVLVYEGRIVPAFYSSANGGRSQDAAAVFPDRAPDIRPLWGGPRGNWDRDSPYHRWGPIHRDRYLLSQRLAAWGKRHRHPIADLRRVSRIWIAQRSRSGRPTAFVVMDQNLRQFSLMAEQFRFACNYKEASLSTLSDNKQLRSSDIQIRVGPNTVSFMGHGHGHGVGLSQWGAQSLAQNGYGAHEILGFYYPGAIIERAY